MGLSGPFIVTLRKPTPHAYSASARVLAREAVEHHTDALIACFKLIGQGNSPAQGWARTAVTKLGPEGGLVPLADGSVVEVEATTWERLASDVGIVPGDRPPNERERATILALWRERHGVEARS